MKSVYRCVYCLDKGIVTEYREFKGHTGDRYSYKLAIGYEFCDCPSGVRERNKKIQEQIEKQDN